MTPLWLDLKNLALSASKHKTHASVSYSSSLYSMDQNKRSIYWRCLARLLRDAARISVRGASHRAETCCNSAVKWWRGSACAVFQISHPQAACFILPLPELKPNALVPCYSCCHTLSTDTQVGIWISARVTFVVVPGTAHPLDHILAWPQSLERLIKCKKRTFLDFNWEKYLQGLSPNLSQISTPELLQRKFMFPFVKALIWQIYSFFAVSLLIFLCHINM